MRDRKAEAGFSLTEMLIAVALLGFVAVAVYSFIQNSDATSGKLAGKLATRHEAFSLLERFRSNFQIFGGGANSRTVADTSIALTQRRYNAAGTLTLGMRMSYQTQCEPSTARNFPKSLLGKALPPVPSLCGNFSCGASSRPVVVETRSKPGQPTTTMKVPAPGSPGKANQTLGMAICFQNDGAYLSVEAWSATREAKDGPIKWQRQAMLLPTTPSVSGNVTYLPAKD